jgi:hypothetical protein
MKKLLFLFLFSVMIYNCAAPALTREQKKDQRAELLFSIERQRYDKEFSRFIDRLKQKESGDDWTRINQIGCIGSFQFTQETLRFLGYAGITPERFKQDPGIFPYQEQLRALKALIRTNEQQLGKYMGFIGKTVNGTMITRAGIIAGAHLGGIVGVMMYLSSGGHINNKDINSTSIQDYIREFQGYNI